MKPRNFDMSSVQDHPKDQTSKSKAQRHAHARAQTPASPPISPRPFPPPSVTWQPQGVAMGSHALEDAELLQQKHWERGHASLTFVMANFI